MHLRDYFHFGGYQYLGRNHRILAYTYYVYSVFTDIIRVQWPAFDAETRREPHKELGDVRTIAGAAGCVASMGLAGAGLGAVGAEGCGF
jgi:hypothetical protein